MARLVQVHLDREIPAHLEDGTVGPVAASFEDASVEEVGGGGLCGVSLGEAR